VRQLCSAQAGLPPRFQISRETSIRVPWRQAEFSVGGTRRRQLRFGGAAFSVLD